MMAAVHHYQGLIKAKTEVQCRIFVGDRLSLLRLRFSFGWLGVLGSCFAQTIVIHSVIHLRATNPLCLFAILVLCIVASSFLLGGKRGQ